MPEITRCRVTGFLRWPGSNESVGNCKWLGNFVKISCNTSFIRKYCPYLPNQIPNSSAGLRRPLNLLFSLTAVYQDVGFSQHSHLIVSPFSFFSHARTRIQTLNYTHRRPARRILCADRPIHGGWGIFFKIQYYPLILIQTFPAPACVMQAGATYVFTKYDMMP